MYAIGQGVAQDYAEAVKWYRRAAKQGYAKAQSNLGVRYRKGQGAGNFMNAATAIKLLKSGISVGMHPTGVICQMLTGACAFPVGREPIPRGGWRFAQVGSSDRRCHVIEPQSREFSREVTT